MVEARENSISLFSRPSKKRRKTASNESRASEPEIILKTADASAVAEDTKLAAHRGTSQPKEAADVKEPHLTMEVQPADLENGSGAVSTSGRTAKDDRPVTFRSLGVSEWLDRSESFIMASLALSKQHKPEGSRPSAGMIPFL